MVEILHNLKSSSSSVSSDLKKSEEKPQNNAPLKRSSRDSMSLKEKGGELIQRLHQLPNFNSKISSIVYSESLDMFVIGQVNGYISSYKIEIESFYYDEEDDIEMPRQQKFDGKGKKNSLLQSSKEGDLLAEGPARAAEKLGHPEIAMVAKGQAVPAYDPRGMKGMGLGYATSNRGACHLRGYVAAAEMGVEFTTIDIYWEESFPYGGKDQFERLSELVDYAHSDGRNVDIWVWKNWFDIIDPVERATFMDTVKAAGVVGLKCDLVFGQSSESYGNVLLHEQILIEAAERELMINFHGTHKAHGLQRTYPNEITREGLSGLENNGQLWDTHPEFMIPPTHNAALPFTRFLSGPGDYTPATFDSRKIGDTTFTHQLSTVGLFTSPLITLADHFQILQAQTDVLDILLGIPSEWDETLALEPSKIGELAILARRRGSHWWIFAINGDAELATTVTDLDLTFLDNVEYTMTTVSDATQTSFNRNTQQAITADSTLTFNMLAGGGFVARLSPQVSFSQWAADYFPEGSELALPLANPDGDSMNNLIEFALGGNPTLRDLSLLPQPKISAIGEQQYLSFTHSLREDLHQLATGNMGTNYTVDGINYTLETSPDLATWTSESEDITIVGTPAPNGDGTVSVTFRMTQAIGPENQAQFIRLTLSLVP